MTDNQLLEDAENLALLNVGGNYFVMPIEQAMAVLMLFKKAKHYEYRYDNNAKTHYIGGELPNIEIGILSSDVYAEGIINGPRKRI
jgi:hypothetical protein